MNKTKELYLFVILLTCFYVVHSQNSNKYTISGYVTEKGSKENLPGVNIYVPKLKSGTVTNNYGFYSITLEEDSVELIFSFVGYQPQKSKFFLNKSTTLNIQLGNSIELQEITIDAEQQKKISDEVQMSTIEIPVEQIKQIPALLGEKDVLKVLQLMPGVQKGSEGSSGFYVRGGGPDQNLIILDDATVYNATHLFGFFSLFNGDALKSVELTKGGFPARYGGRLSSVLEMQMKDGNKEMIHGEAGIGLLSSRLTLEGPIIKDKCSFLISGRRTYIDALIYPLMSKEQRAGYYFYDLNAKVNYVINEKNRLYLSGYFGKDKIYFSSQLNSNQSDEGSFKWGNATGTFRWNHLFSEKIFSNTSLIYTNYTLNLTDEIKMSNTENYFMSYSSGIRDVSIKYSLDYMPSPKHFIKTGAVITYHHFTPSATILKMNYVPQNGSKTTTYNSFENGIFVEDDWKITQTLRANTGIRLSHFNAQNKNYLNPEPRLAMRYLLRDDLSLKASFATMNQYLHLLSNTGVGLPTDLWVPATNRISPQRSNQVAVGMAKDFFKQGFFLSLEGYYKTMNNVIAYKEGASFLDLGLNEVDESTQEVVKETWEDKVTVGKGWSYGAELLIQKKVGKFSGWIGYTLSWTQLQFDELNFGKKYYARYDRRHDISVVGIYKFNDHITLSATWVYGTGNAITLPKANFVPEIHNIPPYGKNIYTFDNSYLYSDYGAKNSFRMAAYHRMDVGIQFHKQLKRSIRTFELSFYNLYNRMNPFFYYIEGARLKQITLFPILPSVSWSYKF